MRVGELSAHVWETPGHCRDHIAYWFAADRALFAGDTLFTLGCGRVMELTFAEMWSSLTRLAALPDEARVYSGHDYVLRTASSRSRSSPTMRRSRPAWPRPRRRRRRDASSSPRRSREEKATNPFLRAGEPSVARAVKMEGADPGKVFQALREWKNRF